MEPNAAAVEKHYTVELRGDHVYLVLENRIEGRDLRDSTDEILAMAKKANVHNLLDDIRHVDKSSITIGLQTTAISLLWRLKDFKKIAILYGEDEIGRLVRTTLEIVRFTSDKCRAFDNESEAVVWLQEE